MKTPENKWFVVNDNGDIIGHDMSETAAKLLASEMKSKKTYFIEFYGTSGDGYVSYGNDSCNSLDMAMTFDTEEEAKAECEKLQKEWQSKLRVTFYADESWEAFCSDNEREVFQEGKDYFTTEKSYNEAIHKINAEFEEGSKPYDYLITDNFADYHYKEIINDYQIYGIDASSNQFLVIKESDDKSEWLETYFIINHTPEEIKRFLLNK